MRTQQRNNTTDYAVLYVTPSVTQTTPQHFAYYLASSDIGVPFECHKHVYTSPLYTLSHNVETVWKEKWKER